MFLHLHQKIMKNLEKVILFITQEDMFEDR